MVKSKDDERNNSKTKLVTEKGSSTSGSITIDTSELRRSTRGTPYKKQMISSNPSSGPITRKSTRLEKRAPVTPPLKSKPEVVVEKSTPLRRSDRAKKQENSSGSSGSKKPEKESGSMNNKQTKGRIRKSVRRLMVESLEVSRSSIPDGKTVGGKRKRISVAGDDELEESDKSSQDESGEDSGNEISQQIGEDSGLEKSDSISKDSAEEQSQNNTEVQLSDSSEKHSEPNKTSDSDNKNSSKEDKLVDSTVVEKSNGCNIALQITHKQYTRKRSKIPYKNIHEGAKRLKSVTELNNNSIDFESSKILRDSSQKEDLQVDNNTMSNGDLPSSPICKINDSVKYSRWRDKEVQILDDSPENSGDEKDVEKQKKTVVAHSEPVSKKTGVEAGENAGAKTDDILNSNNYSLKPVLPTANSFIAEVCIIEPEERTTPSIEQPSFKLLLKRMISRLSEVLNLSEDLKAMALNFLDYVIENHHVNKEPGTILQAFIISLCWIAASLLKKKVDKKESLSLARKHLGFTCKEEEADSVYSKLRLLKKKFRQKIQVPLDVRTNDKLTNGIKSPQHCKIDEHMTTILQNQPEEIQKFQKSWDEKRVGLEKNCKKLESAFINIPEKRDKLNILTEEFAKKMEEHKIQKEISLKGLQPKQLGERNDERLKSGAKVPSGTPNLAVDLRFKDDEVATVVVEKESTDSSDLSKSEEHLSEVPGTVGPAVESDREDGKTGDSGSDKPDSTTDKNDDVTSSFNCASPSSEPLSLRGYRAQTDQSNHEGQILSQDADMAASQLSPPSEPTPVPRTKAQTPSQNADVADSQLLPPSELTPVPCTEGQTPSRDADVVDSQLPLPSEPPPVPRTEGQTPSQDADVVASQLPLPSEPTPVPRTEGQTQDADVATSQLAEGPTVIIAQDILQTGENPEVNSLSNSTEIAAEQNQQESQPTTETVVGPTEPAVTQSISNAESAAEIRNLDSSQNRVNHVVPTQGLNTNFPLFMEPQLTSRMTTLPLYTDPLQNELDSMRRVKDSAAKAHEDSKSRIKYECEKEIEETVARIRRKHGDRLREADAAYLSNKTKMEIYHNRVFMNRLLSHAFRIKCVGPSTSGPYIMENVASSSLMQQQQQHRQSSLPPPVTATSSASHQAMPPPPPPFLPPPGFLQQSATLLSSMPTRPLNISNITPETGNHHSATATTTGEFRAPAPHLQRFRPPSISTASLPSLHRITPGHQSSSSQPLFRPPPPFPPPPPPPPSFLTDHSRNTNNSVPSALQMLLDINNRSTGNRLNLLTPLNMSSFNLPVTGTAGKQVSSSSISTVPADIVCLSDED